MRERLEAWATIHQPTTEYHFPGQNFTGPGTNLVRRILRGDLPNNYQDAVTLIHDIDYMSYMSADEADDRAITRSDASIAGLVTRTGLGIRKVLGLKFNAPSYIGNILRRYVRLHPLYSKNLQSYGLLGSLGK